MTLSKGRASMISQELQNMDICVFPGTRLYRYEDQGNFAQTRWHHHFDFGYKKGSSTHTGVSLFFNKRKFQEKHFTTAQSPDDKLIAGRVGHVRYRKGRQDISVVAFYYPPKPTGTSGRALYWRTCKAMMLWAEFQTKNLPGRCLQMTFGDINDDVGQSRQNGAWQQIESHAIGTARCGPEKFVGSMHRQYCEQTAQGICSTFFKTGHTYTSTQGSGSYLDTWSISLPHVRTITTYRTMTRLGVKLQTGNSSQTFDHIPIMMVFKHQMVHSVSEFFKWDQDRLIIGMNDKSDSARRQFIEDVESELRDNQHLFRATWEETTCDLSWHMINDCILKHGKRHFKAQKHRSDFDVRIEKERQDLMSQKLDSLGQRFDAHAANDFFFRSHTHNQHSILHRSDEEYV